MNQNSRQIRRRKILKTGILGVAAVVFPFKDIIPFSRSLFNAEEKRVKYCAGKKEKKMIAVALKYGGEFAEVKPDIGRNNNGSF